MKALLHLASPGGQRGRLSVLVLHRVNRQLDPLYPEAMDSNRFDALCGWVTSMFSVLPLEQAVRRLRDGSLPPRALAITFDDGYADNLHVAAPILRRHGLPATVFVTSGFIDGGCMWNDIVIESFRRSPLKGADLRGLMEGGAGHRHDFACLWDRRIAVEAVIADIKYLSPEQRLEIALAVAERLEVVVPTNLMMTTADLLRLSASQMQVGSHTVSHPILLKLPPAQIRQEIEGSRNRLVALLGQQVPLFAYPNGKFGEDYDERAVALVRDAGFEAAFTTHRGAASRSTDPFQMPRFTPWDRTRWRFGVRMIDTLWRSRGVAQPPTALQT